LTLVSSRRKGRSAPVPATLTVNEAARVLGLRPDTVSGYLSRRPGLFSTPTYRRSGPHPRLHRALTMADVTTLMRLVLRPRPEGWKRRRKARGAEKAGGSGPRENGRGRP
jgi:hypothetical protein